MKNKRLFQKLIIYLSLAGLFVIIYGKITAIRVKAQPVSSCPQKNQGDANCDGVINKTDFEIWKQQYNSMVPPVPNENNSNFNCVEGNDTTYFVDLVDFEIWRRNTSER